LETNDEKYILYYYTVKVDEPPYTELIINEFQLDTFECGKVKQNPNFLPTPKVIAKRSLRINDEIYDIRQVSLHSIQEQTYCVLVLFSEVKNFLLGIPRSLTMESLY